MLGTTALIEAVELNDVNAVNAALENKNVKINQRNETGWTALTIAAKKRSREIAEKLIKNGVDINLSGPQNLSALHIATQNSDLELMNDLLKSGANVSAK